MKKLYTLLLITLLLAVHASTAKAYKRAIMPFNVAVVQADAIVEAHTVRVPQRYSLSEARETEVRIKQVFKGTLEPGMATLQLHRFHPMALGRLESGKDYLFFLRAVGTEQQKPEQQKFEIMFDGTRPYTSADGALVTDALKLGPSWSPPQDGLSTVLTAEKFRIKADEELDLWMGYKNTSSQSITLRGRNWPLGTHTHWALTVRREFGGSIRAVQHPTVTQEEINDYFSKFPHSYEIVLQPGQMHFSGLKRINSAKPGWGYKERLDFKYYPMSLPGKYLIAATSRNLRGDSILTAQGLAVWVE